MFYPIQLFADWLTNNILSLNPQSHLGNSVNFFIYDSIKILILLIIVNYLMAIIRFYLPIERLRDFLASRNWYGLDYFLASIFGTMTPFCSCSSIPLFIGFLKAKIPLGVTFSFLITSPLVNQVAIVLFVSLFGWKITLLYLISTIFLGMFGGFVLGKLKLEKYIESYIWEIKPQNVKTEKYKIKFLQLIKIFWEEAYLITKKIAPYVFIGIGIGSFIHGFVPVGFFEDYISKDNIFAVPLAVILALPMYANSIGVIPIIESLVSKGIPLGTALSFMMAIVGLSLPEALILKKVMKLKLLLYFFLVVALCIILIGYLFNFIILF